MRLPVFATWSGGKGKMWACRVSCPDLWGSVMMGWNREEGRAPDPAEGSTSSPQQDLRDLTHRKAGGCWSRKMQGVCVGPADVNVEERHTEKVMSTGGGQFPWWGQG